MDKLPDCPPLQPELSTIQMYYLAFSARKKLHGMTGRDNMRLRHVVGHANLLDLITSHEEKGESQAGRQKLEAQAQLQNHILPPSSTVIPDQISSNINIAGFAEAEVVDARFEEGLGADSCLGQKELDIIAAIAPAIADVGNDLESPDELDELMLTRTLSRPLPPCLNPDSQIKDSNDHHNTCGSIDPLLSGKAAVCVTQSIPLLTTPTI